MGDEYKEHILNEFLSVLRSGASVNHRLCGHAGTHITFETLSSEYLLGVPGGEGSGNRLYAVKDKKSGVTLSMSLSPFHQDTKETLRTLAANIEEIVKTTNPA